MDTKSCESVKLIKIILQENFFYIIVQQMEQQPWSASDKSNNSHVCNSLNYSLTPSVTKNFSAKPTNQRMISVLLIKLKCMYFIKDHFVMFAVTLKGVCLILHMEFK